MASLRYRSPTGEMRPWRLKEILQGKPLGHPSHSMFVHFPVAFWIGAVALDVLSRIRTMPQAPRAATWLLVGAGIGALLATVTGLLDWWDMVKGSRKRRAATQHMIVQLSVSAIFAVDLVLHRADPGRARAELGWIAVGIVGVAVLSVGQWLGGRLVYEMGMRVSTGEYREHVEGAGGPS